MTDSSAEDDFRQILKIIGRVIAVCAAAFVIMAREGIGPPYFDPLGKAFFWTGIVLIPLFSLSGDVLSLTVGKVTALGLFILQLALVFLLFGRLQQMTFITLTPLCFAQCLIFALPLMLIRKQHRGIWY
jgi:hypothetical protein